MRRDPNDLRPLTTARHRLTLPGGPDIGLSWTDAISVVLSAIGVYLAFLILIRIVGQRALAAMSSFDFAARIAVGAIMGRAVLG